VAFGKNGVKAVTKELMQLHDKGVMVPRAANMLTKEEKHRVLQYLMYLKETRCGVVKSREVCAPMGKNSGCTSQKRSQVHPP
jgi:hypothetical protein